MRIFPRKVVPEWLFIDGAILLTATLLKQDCSRTFELIKREF